MTPSWTGLRFRSSPALELKRIDELPPAQRNALAELQRDSDFYGVLVPRVPGTDTLKSVGRAAAELILSLATPSALAVVDDDIVDLVLDGILEVERDGGFVSGADAFSGVGPALRAGLSRDALLHAQSLATHDAATLTNALYSYNRLPRTRVWATRFPDRHGVLAHLGPNALLERHWHSPSPAGWISFQPRAPRAATDGDAVTWKLYVSPRPEHIRDAFHALVRVLGGMGGVPMKIGPDAAGLLRPDKLIAYFASKEELDGAARALAPELRGCPAHGVPFTAAIDADGLLSWGADPPGSERALSWIDRESWRLWVTKTLAAALSIGKQARAPVVAPWEFAVARARRRGIDVDTWAPSATLWSSAA